MFLFTSLSISVKSYTYNQDTFANLIIKTTGGGTYPDYSLFIGQYLRDIGIDIEVKVYEWPVFYGHELPSRDFDLAIIDINYDQFNPLPSLFFSLEGSRNYFFSDAEIPYVDICEKRLMDIYLAKTEAEKQHFYYLWQQTIMDKILPCLPLYSPRKYISSWSNLMGYDNRWSLANNMPYLSFNGYHEGQDSIDEFILRENSFLDLNPLLIRDDTSRKLASFLFEPIIQISPECEILTSGLIYEWEEIYENHFRFFVRDNIFWNPSFDITGRTDESLPLDITETPLMNGLKGESSDGTNQELTAKDIAFTLLAYASNSSSNYSNQYEWIKEIRLDPANDFMFDIIIDVDPTTVELDSFDGEHLNFFFRMNLPCLPEFFLNSTDNTIVYTTGNIPIIGLYNVKETVQWENFSESAFGCGKYILDYTNKTDVAVLQKNPNWHGFGPREGKNQSLEIEKIAIRIIPEEDDSLAWFKAGKLDLMDVTMFPQERKLMQADPRFEVFTGFLSEMSCLAFNLERPFIGGKDNLKFLDEKSKEEYTKALAVRKAICYAIDREEMNQVLHDGEFTLVHSPVVPYFSYYYFDDIIRYDRDLDSAIEWLEAAGYWKDNFPSGNSFLGIAIFFWTIFGIAVLILVPFISFGIIALVRRIKSKIKV